MITSNDSFIEVLQQHARRQSKLEGSPVFPSILYPVTTFIGENPWQTLLITSFFSAWVAFLLWFEIFYNFVHNIL